MKEERRDSEALVRLLRALDPWLGHLVAAGFQEEFIAEAKPPITHYRLGGDYGEFFAEFLTPLVGGSQKPKTGADLTARIAGVSAQKLLIHSRRKPGERAKDILYIHDTIETFGRSLAAIELLGGGRSPPVRS